jgi:hypothetical protein
MAGSLIKIKANSSGENATLFTMINIKNNRLNAMVITPILIESINPK